MLQQTQVKTVIPYYNKWIQKYPTLTTVAEAQIDDLLKLWEGLGYYSRCRNFFKACQIIMNQFGGKIPSNISEFKTSLKVPPGFLIPIKWRTSLAFIPDFCPR